MPPSGFLKVLHAPVRWGGIRRTSQTKIYNLETDEFVSNLLFSKIYTNSGGNNYYPFLGTVATSGGFSFFFFQTARKLANPAAQRQAAQRLPPPGEQLM